MTDTTPPRASLDETLAAIKSWRARGLPLLNDRAVRLLVKRLQQALSVGAGDDRERLVVDVVDILSDRATYGVEIDDVRTLYPLFVELSRPVRAARDGAVRASETLLDLLDLSRQHTGTTLAEDAFAHVATLASCLEAIGDKGGAVPTRIDRVMRHVIDLGEDAVVGRAATTLSRREREILRFRAMRVTELLRKRPLLEEELEWFAHLTERLVVLTK